jgi:hypothetical protein
MKIKTLTNWQAVGIGTLTGVIADAFVIFTMVVQMNYSVDALPVYMLSGGVLIFSIAGALVGKFWRKSRRATIIGSIIGPFVPIIAITVLILVYCSTTSCG